MPKRHLTERAIEQLETPTTRQNYQDDVARGLTLRHAPTGSKVWVFSYRVNGSENTNVLTLGNYAELGLAAARTLANSYRTLIDQRIDPRATHEARLAATAAPPEPEPPPEPDKPVYRFKHLTEHYLEHIKGRKKPATREEYARQIKKDLLPAWGEKECESFERSDVADRIDAVKKRGITTGANRLLTLIGSIFSYGIKNRGLKLAHPSYGMEEPFIETPRKRLLADDETRALWLHCVKLATPVADAVRLLMLLGLRTTEIFGLMWSEVRLAERVLVIDGPRMKNSYDHRVPFGPMVYAILKKLRANAAPDAVRVFPGLTRHHRSYRKIMKAFPGVQIGRDNRRTFGTSLGNLDIERDFVGRLLSHAKGDTADQHYNFAKYDKPKRAAFIAREKIVTSIISGKRRKPSIAA